MRFNIDLYADNLMLPEEALREKRVEEQTIKRIVRLRDIYNYMLRNPLKKDREYIDYIQANYKDTDGNSLSKRKAYEDIEILHAVIGNLQQCSKEWHRWRFNNMIMEGYAIALRHEDAAAIAKLAQQYGKYNQLDKNDERDNGLSEVPHLVFVFDVTVQGFQPIPNVYQVIDKLFNEFAGRYDRIAEDADAVEIANEPEKLPAHGNASTVSE
ncbi:hypothetical protein [uncultured Prevotella sp.]|uniref:hypothetical protein n=1 Tax=uncultured Prevotella sp. TaxID=159272 RepID=UPI00258A2ECA|nr:hypothetical protein [uncultured Prevotella sp.]